MYTDTHIYPSIHTHAPHYIHWCDAGSVLLLQPVNSPLLEDQKQLDGGPPAQQSEAAQRPSKRLSTTQLVLRRGFTTGVMVLLLVLGVVVHYLVPLPESPAPRSESNRTLGWANVTDSTAPGLPTLWDSPG